MRWNGGAILVLLGLLSVGNAGAQPFADYSGAQLYQRFCASCHGIGGAGDGPVAASFKTLMPDLGELQRRSRGRFPEERVRGIIDGRQAVLAHGSREMPVWGHEFAAGQGADEAAQTEAARMVDRLVQYLHAMQR